MNQNIDTGGPAFPIPLQPGQSWQGMAPCDGMTLLDYFAAHAPPVPPSWHAKNDAAANIVTWRWAYAAAMINERNKTK